MTRKIKLVTVQKKGQVTIPVGLRRKYRIEDGSVIAVVETDKGILLSPSAVLTTEAMKRLEQALNGHGVILNELFAV